MKKIDNKHFIWAEKYRPQTLDDIILPLEYKNMFSEYISQGKVPHILANSNMGGTGKSTLANVISNDLKADLKWINASQDRGIDTMRDTIRNFVISETIDDSPKIVVLDECDGLLPDAQKVLRGIIEEFSQNSSFILTCNYVEKIIEPLRNRCIEIDFGQLYFKHKKDIGLQIFNRLKYILDNEKVQYTDDQVKQIIQAYYPSVRKMIVNLQKFSTQGVLSFDSSMLNNSGKYEEIMTLLKAKNFNDIRKTLNDIDDPGSLYTFVFKNLDTYFKDSSIPYVVLLCAKYQDMHNNSRDKSITASAFCVEIMSTVTIEMK